MTEITVYRWAGKKLFFKIHSSCEECDITVHRLKDLEKRFPEFISLIVKPWLTFVFEALSKGGWHAPVVLVDGRVFSQGVVPDIQKLAEWTGLPSGHTITDHPTDGASK